MDEWKDYGTAEANSGELHDRDRLSELPDSLIIEILSLLDMKDVVRTSLLSQRWRNLWSTIPCLDLLEQTTSIISSVLAQWKGPKILKFCLSFRSLTVGPSSVIDSWLLFAIEKHVEELFLVLTNWRDRDSYCLPHDSYCLPQPLYSCSSITKLTLDHCKLRIEENVQWNQLKILKIKSLDGLSGDAINQILLGAPRLEELLLKYLNIGENENFNIQSTSLKMLKIHMCQWPSTTVLGIWAPNLLNFQIYARIDGTFLLDVPSLADAILCFLHKGDVAIQFEMFNHVFRSIRHVEKVTLSHWCIQLLVELKNKDMVTPLSNSKILKLYNVNAKAMLDLVGMMFPKLERLIVHQSSRQGTHVTSGEEIHIAMVDACNSLASAKMTFPSPSLLHLKTFEATWSMRKPSIILAIQILLEKACILEKMVIRLRRHESDPETFVLAQEKVLSMPRSSPTAQVIISLIDS
ncbi:F-box/LRR-repeat protein At3g26922-like [Salvia miltiorrhiza]|uniref:F-box/LRR-repeat protein At3g26922-like n=1 Tax=Salvia miltiorrhiza TaxID=226208 RepID=UPI0025AD40BC|nr:F-box/LRR-repeat protein At3g26922-like [Salvia miltiorrhiza]